MPVVSTNNSNDLSPGTFIFSLTRFNILLSNNFLFFPIPGNYFSMIVTALSYPYSTFDLVLSASGSKSCIIVGNIIRS
jgi:hypothetical protein